MALTKKMEELSSYEDDTLDNRLRNESKINRKRHKINLYSGQCGVGKSFASIRRSMPDYHTEEGVVVFNFSAPQNILFGVTVEPHIDDLKEQFPNLIAMTNPTMGDYVSALSRRKEGQIIVVRMSTSRLNTNHKKIINELKRFGVILNSCFICDEIQFSGTSSPELLQDNIGSEGPSDCVRFSTLDAIRETGAWVEGLTGSLLKEQKDKDFGSEHYHIINEKPTKDELALRVSGNKEVHWFDKTEEDPRNTVIEFLCQVTAIESELIDIYKTKGMFGILNSKRTSFIAIETCYKEKEKVDTKWVITSFDNKVVPAHLDFDIAFPTSDKKKDTDEGKITIIRFQGGKSILLTEDERDEAGYYDLDSIITFMNNEKSRLKHMSAINMGNMGMDIPNMIGALNLRVYGSKDSKGVPVVITGRQFISRPRRLFEAMEKLRPYFTNDDELRHAFVRINSFILWLPESEYWREAVRMMYEDFYSADQVDAFIVENTK
jgi:hypothetical protein